MSITQNVKRAKADYDMVYAEGKKSEYDAFWDIFQNYGVKTTDGYQYAFMYTHWNDENFRPKYDLNGGNFYYAFMQTGIKDIPACLERQGVVLDTSEASSITAMFSNSRCEVIPSIDTRNVSKLINIYYACWYCHTIGTIILRDDGSQEFSNCFYGADDIINISIQGTIGQNGFDIHWAKNLSKASILSILSALSTTTNGLTVTLSLTAVNKAFEDHEGDNNGVASVEWAELRASHSNWTIATPEAT